MFCSCAHKSQLQITTRNKNSCHRVLNIKANLKGQICIFCCVGVHYFYMKKFRSYIQHGDNRRLTDIRVLSTVGTRRCSIYSQIRKGYADRIASYQQRSAPKQHLSKLFMYVQSLPPLSYGTGKVTPARFV